MGQASPFDRRISEIITPTVEALGFELVRVRLSGAKRKTLQIMAERADGTMSVEDCAELSRGVSAVLDVEDPLEGEYDLEVSSPGIDRPLTRMKDFAAWAGFEAKLELARPLDGRRRFKGLLRGTEGADVLMETTGPDGAQGVLARLPFEDVAEARLTMNDELLKAAQVQAQLQAQVQAQMQTVSDEDEDLVDDLDETVEGDPESGETKSGDTR